MKFGIRECTNVVFRATDTQTIGSTIFRKGQPVLYIDSAKTSTLEGAATTVYATGGRGNTRLLTWEGEKTLTFTVEDALLSPLGFSILSGAGLFKESTKTAHVHQTILATVGTDNTGKYVDIADGIRYLNSSAQEAYNYVDIEAPLFVSKMVDGTTVGVVQIDRTNTPGSTTGTPGGAKCITASGTPSTCKIYLSDAAQNETFYITANAGDTVAVDFYIVKSEDKAMELQIDAEHFAGYYYVEADTLVRKQSTGKDVPAIITLPKVKIQSNFSFTMASSGDPSTFTFTMDAMPGYTYFDRTKQVLCVFQIVDESGVEASGRAVMRHDTGYNHGHEGMEPVDEQTATKPHDSYYNAAG